MLAPLPGDTRVVYFVLSDKFYADVTTFADLDDYTRENTMYLPVIESWHVGDLPLNNHGNIIRYLICKTLGVDTLAWRSMDIQQCGICVVEIRSKGTNRKMVLSHNDVGHIPKNQRTFI